MSGLPRSSEDLLEAFFAPNIRPELDAELWAQTRAAWRLYRRQHQAARRISSTTLPAVTGAALEVESARRHAMQAGELAARSVEHATKALDAIGGITRGRQEPDPTEIP